MTQAFFNEFIIGRRRIGERYINMFNLPPQLQRAGDPPTKRRRLESGVFGSSFRQKVTGIVGRNKKSTPAVPAGTRSAADDGARKAQRRIDEYFGWGAGAGIDEELAGILEGVMGEDGEAGNELGEVRNEVGKVGNEDEGKGERKIPQQQTVGMELERQEGVLGGVKEDVMDDRYRVIQDEEVIELETEEEDDYQGRVYAWLDNDDHGSGDMDTEDEMENAMGALKAEKSVNDVPRKGEDLAAMVKRLSTTERRERKETKKRKKRKKPMSEDTGYPDVLAGNGAKKRGRHDSGDEQIIDHHKKRRQLITPMSSPIDIEGLELDSELSTHSTAQASQAMNLKLQYKPESYVIRSENVVPYTHLLNSTIHSYINHSIYSPQEGSSANLDTAPLEASYILGSYWTSDEKQRFFDYLATKGRHDLPGISEGVGTKSIVEVRAYLKALEEGLRDVRVYVRRLEAAEQCGDEGSEEGGDKEEGDMEQQEDEVALIQYEDIPAAMEISREMEKLLNRHAEELEKKMLKEEVVREKERWGEERWKVGSKEVVNIEEFSAKGDVNDTALSSQQTPPPPETELLKTHNLLKLSRSFFMLYKPHPDNPLSQINGDEGNPAIRLTTLGDLRNLAVSLTQKLVQASLFIAQNRIASSLLSDRLVPSVRASDVRVAVGVMGLMGEGKGKKEFWVDWVKRSGVRVNGRRGAEITLEEAQRELRMKIGDLKKRKEARKAAEEDEMDGAIQEEVVDVDGDREMGEAPPPAMEEGREPEFVGGGGVEEEGSSSMDDSEDEEHAWEEAVHMRAEKRDIIASAKAELALWDQLLPENTAPPEGVARKLQEVINTPLTDPDSQLSSASHSTTSTDTNSQEETSDSDSNSDPPDSASDSSRDSSSNSGTTTPLSTSAIIAEQAKKAGRRRRLLEDWEEDWVDNYPCYAAWATRFDKLPSGSSMGAGYGYASEGEGSWSGDDDDVTDTSSARMLGRKNRGMGHRRAGSAQGNRSSATDENEILSDAQRPPSLQSPTTTNLTSNPLLPPNRVRGRPRVHPIVLDSEGRRVLPRKSDCPSGRPKLTEEQRREKARSKALERPKKSRFLYGIAGPEELDIRHVPDVRWVPDEQEIDEDGGVDDGDLVMGGVGVAPLTGGAIGEMGVGGRRGARVSGRQRKAVERVGMVSTVQAVVEAEMEEQLEREREGEDGDDERDGEGDDEGNGQEK